MLAPEKIPEERFAGGARFRVFLLGIDGPDRRIQALDAFVVREQRFQRGEYLQALFVLVSLAPGKQRPDYPGRKNIPLSTGRRNHGQLGN